MPSMPDAGGGFFVWRFLSGARLAASGIGFTFAHRRLLLWSLVPMAVQAALFTAILVVGWRFLDRAVAFLSPEAGHWYSFAGALVWLLLVIALVLVSVVGALFLGSVVCDPFYDVLAETTESILVGRDVSAPFSVGSVAAGIVREAGALPWRLCVYLAVAVPLWLLGFTGVGSIVAVPLSLLWTWMFVALAGMSRAMARHALKGKARIGGVFAAPGPALGFGAVGWLMSHVPLTYPFLVVGGTRLYLTLAAHDRIPNSLTDDDKRTLRGGPA